MFVYGLSVERHLVYGRTHFVVHKMFCRHYIRRYVSAAQRTFFPSAMLIRSAKA